MRQIDLDTKYSKYDMSDLCIGINKAQKPIILHNQNDGFGQYMDVLMTVPYSAKDFIYVTSFNDYLKEVDLQLLSCSANGNPHQIATTSELRQIKKILEIRGNMDPKEVENLKTLSNYITKFVSDLLGLNIAVNPAQIINPLQLDDTKNVLVPATKLAAFKEQLASLIEIGLYDVYNTSYSLIVVSDADGLDYRIKGALKKAGISVTNELNNNHFRLKANNQQIEIKEKNNVSHIVNLEPKSSKVLKFQPIIQIRD